MPMFSQGIVTPAEGEKGIMGGSTSVSESGQREISALFPNREKKTKRKDSK